LAVLAAIGLRVLNRRCAGLTPPQLVMRFVLLFVIGAQYVLLVREPRTAIPSDPERRNMLEVDRLLDEIAAEVYAPHVSFQLWLHKGKVEVDPSGAKALLLPLPVGDPHWPQSHALPAYPSGQHGHTRAGGGFEALWWIIRPDDARLAERIRESV